MLPVKLMQVKIYKSVDTRHTGTFVGTDGVFIILKICQFL